MSAENRFSFAQLTPDHLLSALESIGVYAESGLLALNSYENRVSSLKLKMVHVMLPNFTAQNVGAKSKFSKSTNLPNS